MGMHLLSGHFYTRLLTRITSYFLNFSKGDFDEFNDYLSDLELLHYYM